jgi:8-oxo-dGTP diphosphatase
MSKTIDVAVAILQKNASLFSSGEFLLASRPNGKGWAGWWEFPGGKIEANESPQHALKRELQEELGITPTQVQQWLTRRFDYPQTHDSEAKTVLLHFYFVNAWQGEISAKEGQQLSWQNPQNIIVSPVLPANAPIMQALALSPIYAISNLAEMGEHAWLNALETQLKNGLSLIQLREKQLAVPAFMGLAEQVLKMAKTYDAKVLINSDIELAQKIGADGVHLSSLQLIQLTEKPSNLPKNFMVAASCHNALELAHAQQLGLDFVLLSPVNATKSHEDAATLGWENFSALIQPFSLPVYALGGMQMSDFDKALSCGARGIGMQRAVWK